MPRDIRVGDKVRLLGWEGMLEGFGFTPKMAELAGTIVTVGDIISPYDEPYIKVNHWAWPLSSVEPLDAPRPSAWTKTSDALPQREPGDSSDHARCYVVRRKSPSNVEILMWNFYHLVWDGEDGDDFECQADEVTHWQLVPPYPDPPEVSK